MVSIETFNSKVITDEEWHKFSLKEKLSFTGLVKWWDGYINHLEDGLLHRLDGPAVVWPDGTKFYWINGLPYSIEEWEKHPKVLMCTILNSKEFKDVLRYKNL